MAKKKIKTTKEEMAALRKSLDSLEDRIEETNSTPRVLLRGIFTGLGSVIGATIVFAIVLTLLSWFIASTDIAWIQDFISTFGIKEQLD